MRLSIESDGTLQGTTFDFHMTGAEIPQMLERRKQRRLQLKRLGPEHSVESCLTGRREQVST